MRMVEYESLQLELKQKKANGEVIIYRRPTNIDNRNEIELDLGMEARVGCRS